MLYIWAPAMARPRYWPTVIWKASTPRSIPIAARTSKACSDSSGCFRFPEESAVIARRRPPGSIHEGGELGYSLSHAFGAAFDNPDLIVAAVVGDGEAETGPLATSWHSNKFLNPIRDGAVLPILHLNGYKIADPTILARITPDELENLFVGYGYKPYVVEGDDPPVMHQQMASTLERCTVEIRAIQEEARRSAGAAPAALADDNPAHSERLDRAQGGRRPSGRG